MAGIDLHTHTTASDGILTPSALIDYALARGIAALAITDHDTTGGLDEAVRYALGKNIDVIPGIEFSVEYPRGSFHLVGLYIDFHNTLLDETLKKLKHLRDTRASRIIDDLRAANITIALDDVIEEAGGAPLGKPHFARVMVQRGYGKSVEEIFKKYLVDGKPGDIKKEKITPADAIALIKGSGGVPVLAHPASLEFSSFAVFEDELQAFIEMGLEGIEAYAAMHSPDEADEFARIARKYDLLISGGSDFHGDKNEILGAWHDGMSIPYNLYKTLQRHHAVSHE